MLRTTRRDSGFSLAALMFFLMATSVMITVSVPSYLMQARREREKELIFRGEEYARAIQKYQRTLNLLPTSNDMSELLSSNGTRFLRKAYTDPVSGEMWRAIVLNTDGTLTGSNVYQSMGQVPTTTSQLNTATAANNTNSGAANTATSANGSLTTNRVTNSLGGGGGGTGLGGGGGGTGLGAGGGGTGLGAGGGNGLGGGGTANGNRPNTTGAASPTAAQPAQPQAQATPLFGIVGVGSGSKGTGVMIYNKQDQYSNWEFIAQLQQRGNTGGGATGGGGGGGGGGAAGGGGGGGGAARGGGGGGGRGQ